MAWTNLTFPFGTTLTASKMNALQNNFTGFATRLSGAPRVVGGADKMCVFSANGHIFSSQGVSSITHGATGSYASGFEVNVAYSDNNGRAFTGLSAATTNSGTYPMMTRAGNNSSDIGNFDVYTGCVVWLENTTV